jgi:putative methionine-R-sulfoxide reductase with GAF domain
MSCMIEAPFDGAIECVTAAAAVGVCSRAFSNVVLSGSS